MNEKLRHDHTFGQEIKKAGEPRTLLVIGLTAVTMVVEIAAGVLFGSMALLADGLHMASHTAALGISAIAYVYARRHAADEEFSFGSGKVNALGGFAGAMLLAIFSLIMAGESVKRFLAPVPIAFDQAITVAFLGLVVNGVSAVVLHGGGGREQTSDHNLKAAYLHVLADALTSILAIGSLLVGKYFGWSWMDPAMGIVGSILVGRWSIGLLRTTSGVLLDRQAPPEVRAAVQNAVESLPGNHEVVDLHVWSIGPGFHSTAIVVLSDSPRSPDEYRDAIPGELKVVHATVEVHRAGDG